MTYSVILCDYGQNFKRNHLSAVLELISQAQSSECDHAKATGSLKKMEILHGLQLELRKYI